METDTSTDDDGGSGIFKNKLKYYNFIPSVFSIRKSLKLLNTFANIGKTIKFIQNVYKFPFFAHP